jgi:hypothetical protein
VDCRLPGLIRFLEASADEEKADSIRGPARPQASLASDA